MMNKLSELKTHDPAKAAVLSALFDIVQNEMRDKETYQTVWDEDKAREALEQSISDSVYSGGGFLERDQLSDYETEFYTELKHMTIADYCPDAKHIHEFDQIETRYWQELERAVLESKAYEVIKEISEKLVSFYWYLDDLSEAEFWGKSTYKKDTFQDQEPNEAFQITGECPHGWQAHSDEKEEGDLYLYRWIHGQVEELNAISLSMYGGALWATLSIDPKDQRGLLWELRQ